MNVENRQMSLAAYVRWTYRAARAAYVEHYLPLGTEQTSVHEISATGMPSTGSINDFRGRDHGHHSGMPDAAYLEMVRDAERAWTNRMD